MPPSKEVLSMSPDDSIISYYVRQMASLNTYDISKSREERHVILAKRLESILNNNEIFKEIAHESHFILNTYKNVWSCFPKSFTLLSIQLELSRALLPIMAEAKKNNNDQNLEALLRLNCRGCTVASEIILLLNFGYPDGAEARWRTLQELEIIARFIATYGGDLGQRYLQHSTVEAKKKMFKFREIFETYTYYNYQIDIAVRQKNNLPNGWKIYKPRSNLTEDERADYDKMMIELDTAMKDSVFFCNKYGKEFDSDYGWAAAVLKGTNINLKTIEDAVTYDDRDLGPFARQRANISVHGNSLMLFQFDLPGGLGLTCGSTVFGLDRFILNTAVTMERLIEDATKVLRNKGMMCIYDLEYLMTEVLDRELKREAIAISPYLTKK